MAKRAAKSLPTDLPIVAFPTAKAWNGWLAKHHTSARGVWLKFAKKSAGVSSVYYPEALEVALCYGWIDGQRRSLDEEFFLQRFTPRTPRSKWSKINCGKVEALIKAGKMAAAGLRQVEAARADGRWAAAYDSPALATVPADLLKALRKTPAAKKHFDALSARNRFAILFRVHDAKRPETRQRRIADFVARLAKGWKPYP